MQTKFSNSLSLHGYMTTLRSEPNHITRPLSTSAMGLVTGSSRPTFRGIRNRNAAFPEPNNFASLMNDLVCDFGLLVCVSLLGNLDAETYVYSIGSEHHIANNGRAVCKLDLGFFRVQADNFA